MSSQQQSPMLLKFLLIINTEISEISTIRFDFDYFDIRTTFIKKVNNNYLGLPMQLNEQNIKNVH